MRALWHPIRRNRRVGRDGRAAAAPALARWRPGHNDAQLAARPGSARAPRACAPGIRAGSGSGAAAMAGNAPLTSRGVAATRGAGRPTHLSLGRRFPTVAAPAGGAARGPQTARTLAVARTGRVRTCARVFACAHGGELADARRPAPARVRNRPAGPDRRDAVAGRRGRARHSGFAPSSPGAKGPLLLGNAPPDRTFHWPGGCRNLGSGCEWGNQPTSHSLILAACPIS